MPLEGNPATRVAFQLTAALQTAITDGEGIAKCLQWDGHGSMRTSFGHSNVVKKNSGIADETLGFVDITCSDRARLGEWTPYIQIVAEDKARKDAAEHGFKANEIIDTVAVEQCVEDALGGEGEAADA